MVDVEVTKPLKVRLTRDKGCLKTARGYLAQGDRYLAAWWALREPTEDRLTEAGVLESELIIQETLALLEKADV